MRTHVGEKRIDNGGTTVTSGAPVELLFQRVFVYVDAVSTEASLVTVQQLPSSLCFPRLSLPLSLSLLFYLCLSHKMYNSENV